MSKIKGIYFRLVFVYMMVAAASFQSFAANARIAFSDPSAQVGSEVSVTMKFTSANGEILGNTDVMLAYDANMLEFINETENASGGAGAIRVWSGLEGKAEIVTVLRFKALQAGTARITVSSWEGYDNDGHALTMGQEGSSTITITALETSSDDATLQSMQISPGVLSPAFHRDTEHYTTTVGMETEKLTVSAKASNEKASVTVEGGTLLQEGENTVVCKVTAEDGTTVKNYVITVNKTEGAENGNTETHEPGADEPNILAELDILVKKIYIIELPDDVEVPKGLKESSIVIGDVKVQGWAKEGDDAPEYCVLYGMNENGDRGFYRYDLTDETVQRYFEDDIDGEQTEQKFGEIVDQYNNQIDDDRILQIISGGLAVVVLVLLVALIVLIGSKTRQGNRNGGYRHTAQNKPEEKAAAGLSSEKKMTKEEQYMMGVEDEFEEDYDYRPEIAATIEEMPEDKAEEWKAGSTDHEENAIAKNLAREVSEAAIASAVEPLEDAGEDDFEIFDLDKD